LSVWRAAIGVADKLSPARARHHVETAIFQRDFATARGLLKGSFVPQQGDLLMQTIESRRRSRRRRQGMTLIEIMIVVVIMSMIAGAAGFAAMEHMKRARIDNTKTQVRSLAQVAEAYLLHHPGASCPSLDELAEDRLLNRGSSRTDPWGGDFLVSCDGDVNVRSAGPDGQDGTDDDISVF
jgi:prepilin-type N-terminal cleavage/methylation domain-containing protein